MPKVNYQKMKAPKYEGIEEDMAKMFPKKKKKKKPGKKRKKRSGMSYLTNKKTKENFLKGVTIE